jgi:hypothetical protein
MKLMSEMTFHHGFTAGALDKKNVLTMMRNDDMKVIKG